MKVVTWNCGGAFRKKCEHLESVFKPDLIVVQECEDPDRSSEAFRRWAGDYLWTGEAKNKGIGVFDRRGVGLQPLDWNSEGLQLFLPCEVADAFTLVAVWTKYANSPNFRYIGQLWKWIQLQRTKLAERPVLLCGDLNSNVRWDEWDRWWNHSDVVRELQELNIGSVYHRRLP